MAALIDLARLKEAMDRAGLDQSSLAREVGCTPSAINQIVSGMTHRSKYLPDIADRLGVTLRWLRRQDDSEQRFSSPKAPGTPTVFLAVSLPDEDALTAMFEALLDGVDRKAPQVEQARQLAQQLPIGLSHFAEARPGPRRHRRSPEVAKFEEPTHTLADGRRS